MVIGQKAYLRRMYRKLGQSGANQGRRAQLDFVLLDDPDQPRPTKTPRGLTASH
jgi:hypothetical protein